MRAGLGVLSTLAIVLSVSGSVAAQVPRHRLLPVEELAASAEVAGIAVVDRVSVRRDPENGSIYTDAILRFEEAWKGSPPREFSLTRYGGTLGGTESSVAGWDYTLAPGERIVVFATPFRGGTFTAVGARQGIFRVSPKPPYTVARDLHSGVRVPSGAPKPMAELRSEVFRALGRDPTPAPDLPPSAEPAAPDARPAAPPPAGTSSSPRAVEEIRPFPRWVVAAIVLIGAGAALMTIRKRRPSGAP